MVDSTVYRVIGCETDREMRSGKQFLVIRRKILGKSINANIVGIICEYGNYIFFIASSRFTFYVI
jgi:hypothetical protein